MAARVGSFKEAARELGVTPTAISHQVRTLEEQLGVALFVRKTRTVVLTEEGKRLAASTLKGFQEIHEGLDALGSSSSRLTIATTPAFAALWLVPRVADLEARHRGFTVHVETSTEPVNLERDRRIDVAIRYGLQAWQHDSGDPDIALLLAELYTSRQEPKHVSSIMLIMRNKLSSLLPRFKVPLYALDVGDWQFGTNSNVM